MRRHPVHRRFAIIALSVLGIASTACSRSDDGSGSDEPAIVVTSSVLASVVRDVVGDTAPVVVLIPNGVDPHEWKPAPQDVEAMNDALLVVSNGLDLEEGLEDTLDQVRASGVPTFEATDHVTILEQGDTAHSDDEASDDDDEHGDEHGAEDPHIWMSAANMSDVAAALTTRLEELGLDVGVTGAAAVEALTGLDTEVSEVLAVVPPERRLLVTGHESLGYFADRYDFELIGTVIPGLSSQAEPSAGDLAELKDEIEAAGVPAIFTELGTPSAVVDAIASETGVSVIELPTHLLPEDGTYRSFLLGNATAIATALG